MVDWNGLFKWSLNYQDGTKPTSEFKQLDEENLKWLEEVMEEYTYAEINAMKHILQELQKDETGTAEDGDKRVALLEELEQLTESIDKGKELFQIGGFPILMRTMFYSQYVDVQLIALRIFGALNQNNSALQDESIGLGAFKLLNFIVSQGSAAAASQIQSIKEQAYSTLCMLLRGENLEVKRKFIDYDGIEFVLKILQEDGKNSRKLRTKSTTLLKDLCLYDEKLHQTFSDLQKFSNTNSTTKLVAGKETLHVQLQEKKKEQGVWFDQNEELKKLQFLPENAKYQNLVRQKLVQYNFVAEMWWILEDLQSTNLDARQQFMQIVQLILQQKPDEITPQQREWLRDHLLKLEAVNTDGLNDTEILTIKEVLEEVPKQPQQQQPQHQQQVQPQVEAALQQQLPQALTL